MGIKYYLLTYLLVRTVSGWLVCGRSDIWIVGGWICSKPVGWLVCLLLSVVWSD